MAKKKTTNSVVMTARQLLGGFTTNIDRRWIWNTMPYQMLPLEEKDEDWRKWNMDWLEYVGLRQIIKENKRLVRNYYLANGIINKSDYIEDSGNELREMINIVNPETNSPFSLKFYPIIPNVLNVLTGEFAKRDNRIIVKTVDEFSRAEALEYKMQLLTQSLVQDAVQKVQENLAAQGIEVNSQEGQQQINTAAQLAEAEVKYKNYTTIAEQWGQAVIESDTERFRMYELEAIGFRDSLIADREFWHIDIKEDDYKLEIWNPVYTFYHKSPDVRYISEGNYVGQILLMSIPDIINMYGAEMNSEQLDELKNAQSIAINIGNAPIDDGRKHDSTQYWDASKPYDKQQPNSIHYEQYMGMKQFANDLTGVSDINSLNWNRLTLLDSGIFGNPSLVRVTKAYWKTQKRVGHLTKITRDGIVINEIVDENYEVTEKPVYDRSIRTDKSKENLIFGEHIDWIWINEVWGGVKIGPNSTTYYQSKSFGFEPIYLNVKPLPFQFKGQNSLYGCKLPVEGKIFSERNSTSSSLVDKMSSNQIGFNIVNNQVVDFLADEVGKVLLVDQNMVPRNSLNGSWGKYNFNKFYQVMKDYQIAPIDSSLQNTEAPATQFSHFQQVDLTKTEMILSRLKLAEYFKNEAFAVVGITPQRVGEVAASESATGVQQAVNNSYAQTEVYFDQHMNYLMPRVRQMMLEAAQFISATKPESTKVYMNSNEQKLWFSIEGYKLLLADYKIYAMSKANVKAIVENLKRLAMENNTAGGSLYELAQVVMSDSPSDIISKLREAEDKRSQQTQAERDHEMQLQQQQQEFLDQESEKQRANENYWKEREIQKDIYIAEIKAMGYAKDTDIDKNNIPDALEVDKFLHEAGISNQDILLKEKKMSLEEKKQQSQEQLTREKLAAEKYKVDMQYKIAKENKPPKTKK